MSPFFSPSLRRHVSRRKKDHLSVCLSQQVESGHTGLNELRFVHRALPETNFETIDTSVSFLGTRVAHPIFISCMTGGFRGARGYNARLAEVAQKFSIPVGVGSIRILLDKESLLSEFQLKKIAPSVPFIANLGAAQLPDIDTKELDDLLRDLKADALALHLNPAQELHQEKGERNFMRIFEYIREYISQSTIPIIIKETGAGMHPMEVHQLLGAGARYVDLSGSGGTNWVFVELFRRFSARKDTHLFESFAHWGNPTGLLLLSLYGTPALIASGGIRNSHDVVASLALGATMTGLALPFLKNARGTKRLSTFLERLTTQIKSLMCLCGARTVSDAPSISFWLMPTLQRNLEAFCKACNIPIPHRFA